MVKAVTMMMRRRKRKKAASYELQYCRNTSIHRHKSCMSKRKISQEDLAIQVQCTPLHVYSPAHLQNLHRVFSIFLCSFTCFHIWDFVF